MTVATQGMLTCSTDDTPWPGYGKGDDPLSTLAGDLSKYVTAGSHWTEDQVVLKKKALDKADRDPVTFSVSLSTDLKQTSWLSSYITPFFGYSGVFTGAESFGLPYGGVQIYLWPNEVHEPMWINGGVDARRLFAFEVGLGAPAVTPQAFGPGDRYRYFDSGFPPVMTGLAIQPFAYTTFSAGLSFMRQVRSPVATEVHQPVRSFYLSVALDINVFNFIRQRITGFPSSVPETKNISR